MQIGLNMHWNFYVVLGEGGGGGRGMWGDGWVGEGSLFFPIKYYTSFSNTGPHISSNIYFLSLPLITLSFELLK